MDRAEYHDTRRTIYRLEIESRLLAAHNRRYPYYGTARDTTADYVAKLRRTIRVPTDQYTASRNQRWASLRRALQQAARDKQRREHAKRELALLRPTGNRVQDGLNQVAISFGGRTAAQVQGAVA